MKKKIAVCLPTYNESENIIKITTSIDISLKKFCDKYECYIVNADNNSNDCTNDIFNNVVTFNKKISIISNEIGKGYNIKNFLLFCKNYDIDFAITIDADLKSFNETWIYKMIFFLENNYDFVVPNYYRPLYEGNTTNHFAVPVIYLFYGRFIRQPIGGEYAFNKKYINKILKMNFSDKLLKYGIDIFMVVTAIVNNFNIIQVDYGVKIHNDSYYKMKNIFEDVVLGFCETYKLYSQKFNQNMKEEEIVYTIKKSKMQKFKYRDFFNGEFSNLLDKYHIINDYETIRSKWLDYLVKFIEIMPNIDARFINDFKNYFMLYCVSFWDKNEKNINWENEIIYNVERVAIGNENSDK